MLTDKDLKDIEDRKSAATPGPWAAKTLFADWGFPYQAYVYSESIPPTSNDDLICSGTKGTHQCVAFDKDGEENPSVQFGKDLDFIAHSREDIDKLLTHIKELTARYNKAVEIINQTEGTLKVMEAATDYVKPGTGIWHAIGIAQDRINKWRGEEQTGEDKQ